MPSSADRAGRGAAAVVLAAALWGTTGTAQELGAPTAAPATVAAVRTLAGGLCFVALLLALGRWSAVRSSLQRARVPVLGAAAAMAVFQVGYLTGVRELGVALGTLLAIGSAPAIAGLVAVATGHRPTPRWLAATAVTIVGAAVLLLAGDRAGVGGGTARLGAAAALLAGAGYAAVATLSKRALDHGADGMATMAVVFLGAGVVLLPSLVAGDPGWVATRPGVLTAVWLALGPTVVAYLLYARGLAGVDAPTATTLSLAEPLVATVLAIVVVGERPTVVGAIGALLLGIGLIGLTVRPRASPASGRTVHRRDGRH